jgi:hypothetical protein
MAPIMPNMRSYQAPVLAAGRICGPHPVVHIDGGLKLRPERLTNAVVRRLDHRCCFLFFYLLASVRLASVSHSNWISSSQVFQNHFLSALRSDSTDIA